MSRKLITAGEKSGHLPLGDEWVCSGFGRRTSTAHGFLIEVKALPKWNLLILPVPGIGFHHPGRRPARRHL